MTVTSSTRPMPPLTAPVATGSAMGRRVAGGVVAAATGAVLGVAVWLEPSGAGLGTHEQLALPSCGWITLMDLPCPTCGMTTAFTHAVEGSFLTSARTQPLGFLLSLATGAAFLLGLFTLVTGSRVARRLTRLWGPKSGWMLAGAVVLAWFYKMASYRGYLP